DLRRQAQADRHRRRGGRGRREPCSPLHQSRRQGRAGAFLEHGALRADGRLGLFPPDLHHNRIDLVEHLLIWYGVPIRLDAERDGPAPPAPSPPLPGAGVGCPAVESVDAAPIVAYAVAPRWALDGCEL